MAELVVFKANELAVSRYDLTEHETKLILFCVAKLNPTYEEPTEFQRTVKFTCSEYANFMELSYENAWGRLNAATSDLFKRSVELIYPTGDVSKRIFNWAEYAEFNRAEQSVTLVFSRYIVPLLFHLKRFIKYNLDHVKSFENKYSMRVYEWLLKELTQRKTHRANIEIGIDEFKFMLMLETKYKEFKTLNRDVLKPVMTDMNSYSNMKLDIGKRGRPADTLIFQCELDKKVDFTKEFQEAIPDNTHIDKPRADSDILIQDLKKLLLSIEESRIQPNSFEHKFLIDMKSKYELNGSFSWLSPKQNQTLTKILAKYRHI